MNGRVDFRGSAYRASPPIFVVGTGRSGTWLLYNLLGCHRAVHTFPSEMRFLIDPNGLMDLVDGLTGRYSPVQARERLYRFERLMRVSLADPHRPPYAGFDFPAWLGGDFYWERLDRFCSELVELEFEGTAWQVETPDDGRLVRLARGVQRVGRKFRGEAGAVQTALPRRFLKVARYFPARQELNALAASFVDDIFSYPACRSEKTTWCEKTPQHLLHLDFLYELFPDAAVIHILRDPRGVAYSLTRQRWAPATFEGACLLLRDIYTKWFMLREQLDLSGRRFLEIKLEELADQPEEALARVLTVCALEGRPQEWPEIAPEKVNNWQHSLTGADARTAERILGLAIDRLGYGR